LEINGPPLKTKSFSFYQNEIPVKILESKTTVQSEKRKHAVEVPVFSAKFNHLKNKRIKMVKFLANYRLECDLNIGGKSSEDDETDVELEENEDAEDEEDAEDIESDTFDYNDTKKTNAKPIFYTESILINSSLIGFISNINF